MVVTQCTLGKSLQEVNADLYPPEPSFLEFFFFKTAISSQLFAQLL